MREGDGFDFGGIGAAAGAGLGLAIPGLSPATGAIIGQGVAGSF